MARRVRQRAATETCRSLAWTRSGTASSRFDAETFARHSEQTTRSDASRWMNSPGTGVRRHELHCEQAVAHRVDALPQDPACKL